MKALSSTLIVIFLSLFSASFTLAAESPAPAKAGETQHAQHLININTADEATLSSLKGIGAKKAEAIIAWRNANGEFQSLDQLAEVKGIGAAILDANRELITLK